LTTSIKNLSQKSAAAPLFNPVKILIFFFIHFLSLKKKNGEGCKPSSQRSIDMHLREKGGEVNINTGRSSRKAIRIRV